MSLTYSSFVTSFANMLVVPTNDPNFNTMLPNAIDYAEQRLYRDLDLLNTIVVDTGGNLTANSRNFTLPQTYGRFVVTESMNVFTPVSTTTNRNALVPVSREWMDAVWGNEASTTTPSIPQYYAMTTDQTILVGPPPDAAYTMEVKGTIRPTPLSNTQQTTYLSLYLPDLFLTAALIFGSGYQLNFSPMADDPQQAQSWEVQYAKELVSANTEEMRKRYGSQGWTAKQPDPIATPPRA